MEFSAKLGEFEQCVAPNDKLMRKFHTSQLLAIDTLNDNVLQLVGSKIIWNIFVLKK